MNKDYKVILKSDQPSESDRVFFELDAEVFRRFVDLLDVPPVTNPGLERLLALKTPWHAD